MYLVIVVFYVLVQGSSCLGVRIFVSISSCIM